MHTLPAIIQGGMGAGVSDWRLANAVSSLGHLGVVSGTALDVILVRRLQVGDPGGHMRRALAAFPAPGIAERIVSRYYVEGGKAPARPFVVLPLHERHTPRDLAELCIAANFVEVFLAREGHPGAVGINFLEKIQVPHLPSIYGAMLAGVDYVIMGAGVPVKIPGVLDRLARHEPAEYPLQVTGAADEDTTLAFDPAAFLTEAERGGPLRRPTFLAIVSSHVLAAALLKKSNGVVNGFVVEGPTAGGHNAPPRGRLQLNERGEPVYGERDVVDLERLRALGLPFWLAGGFGRPGALCEARALGAAGIQVGTAFAFCDESGLRDDLKQALIEEVGRRTARVFTDPVASPASFPFKVVRLEGTLSEAPVYDARARVCDLGYLREAYRQPDGRVGFRCPAEPVSAYVSKGGTVEDTAGRKCICNALMANIGLGQMRGREPEPALVTAGDALTGIGVFLPPGRRRYSASDVIARLTEPTPA
ncbi:MAG: nitronate monooxygenase [Acidobacteria bacterium]|nr:nitronate monooxygenase [Acidobacteriota bacterium]